MTRIALVPVFWTACALLALAGFAKLHAPDSARASLALIGIHVRSVAIRVIGAAELALGAFAAIRPSPLTAGLVTGAYGAFMLTTLRLLAVDGSADCGCFGAASSTASRSHVILNAVACAAGIVAVVFPPPGVEWIVTRAPLIAAVLALGTAAATFAAYAAFTLFAPAWRAYGSRSA
ncbi:MAG: hypothetical protein JO321_08610 [Solirubrobacterales bacterium]|nr:hypothetical protein [Solirubrobacterales bacterium]